MITVGETDRQQTPRLDRTGAMNPATGGSCGGAPFVQHAVLPAAIQAAGEHLQRHDRRCVAVRRPKALVRLQTPPLDGLPGLLRPPSPPQNFRLATHKPHPERKPHQNPSPSALFILRGRSTSPAHVVSLKSSLVALQPCPHVEAIQLYHSRAHRPRTKGGQDKIVLRSAASAHLIAEAHPG